MRRPPFNSASFSPMNRNLWFFKCYLIASLLTLGSCSDTDLPTEPPSQPQPMVSLDLTTETAHFTLRYSESDRDKVEIYANELEGNYQRILSDLGLPSLPKITGLLYPDQSSFTAATGLQALGSVQGRNQFSIVAAPLQRLSLPVHEFVHCATLHLNPGLGSNPVWLWEGVAIYEAEEFVPPSSVPCLATGQYPTLADLNRRQNSCSIYDVGFTLIEFIVDRWGQPQVRQLIANNGDISGTLGLSVAEFERDWHLFIADRYL